MFLLTINDSKKKKIVLVLFILSIKPWYSDTMISGCIGELVQRRYIVQLN